MMKKLLSVAIICLALTACQDTRFVFSNRVPSEPTYSGTEHFVFWDKKATIAPVKVCGSMENVAAVELMENTKQSLIRGVTGSIYSPVTVKVYCKQPVRTNYIPEQPK